MVGPPPESRAAQAKREKNEGVPASLRNKVTTLTGGKRRERIRELLGSNFVSMEQKKGELEIVTSDDIPPGQLKRIEKIWKMDEEA